jgi:hypothetical protein
MRRKIRKLKGGGMDAGNKANQAKSAAMGNVGGLSGGVKYGPPPKRGPNPQVPPIKLKRGGKR